MNILFVIHIKDTLIGGSKISGIDTANRLSEEGHKVFLIADRENFVVKNRLSKNIQIIHFKHHNLWFFHKSFKIYKSVGDLSIEKIVCMDRQSAYISALISLLKKIRLIPIIPGGSTKDQIKIEPLRIPTIVFSEENKIDLINIFKWPEELIFVVPARIDVNKFKSEPPLENRQKKIAFISRIIEMKRESFLYFLSELSKLPKESKLKYKIEVIGDGVELEIWKKIAKDSNAHIIFVGQKQINGELLSEYSLTVGQGRVVLESLASKTPAAICGENGYKGLVNKDNFDMVSKTNFTGRNVSLFSEYKNDIHQLEFFTDSEILFETVKNKYDLSILTKEILKQGVAVQFSEIVRIFKNIFLAKLT